jgi:uncharacterized LabA/DUF88 family protein
MIRRRKKQPQVYAFIDSQNLNVGVQKHGWKMDWKKLREFLKTKYNVTEAFMFIGYVPENEDMYKQLHESGFRIVLKPTYDMTRPRPEIEEGEEKKPIKGNVDAELVLWAMKELPKYSQAIIVSGDGDFFCLVEYLVQEKKLLKLLAPSPQYSSLYNAFDEYVETIDTYRNQLQYRTFSKNRNRNRRETNGQK